MSISNLSDEELMKLYKSQGEKQSDISSLSDEELMKMYKPKQVEQNPVVKEENKTVQLWENDVEKLNQKYKKLAEDKLQKREEWEKAHPVISGIQKDYQPNYRADVEQWKLDAKYGMNKPLKDQLVTYVKKIGLNLVPATNISVDMATGGGSAVARQGLKQATKEAIKQGAKTGVIGGLTQGITSSLADNGISADLLLRPLQYGTFGLLGGGLVGGITPVAIKGAEKVAKAFKKVKPKVTKPITETTEQPQATKKVSAEIVTPTRDYYNEAIQKIKENPEVINDESFYADFDKMTIEQQDSLYKMADDIEKNLKVEDELVITETPKEVKEIKEPNFKKIIEKEKKDSRIIAREILQQATGYKKVNKKILNSGKGIKRIEKASVGDRISVAPELVKENPDLFGYVDFDELGAEEKVIERCIQILDEGGVSPTEIEQNLYKNYYGDMANEVIPEQVTQPTGKTKERGFVGTVRENYGNDVAKQIKDNEYEIYTHKMQQEFWENKTPEQKVQALSDVDNISPDVLYGKAQALNQAIQNGEPINISMLEGVARNLTKAGQEIEATKHFIPTSPEGIALEVVKQTRKNTPKQVLKLKDEATQVANEVAKELPNAKTKKQQLKAIERILSKRVVKPREKKNLATQLLALYDNDGLTPENFTRLVDKHYGIKNIDVEDYAKIQELSDKFINATTDRERDVANGLIKKFIWSKQPKRFADRDKTFRNMNMLLSIPSRTLDVVSTTAFQGARALDELVAKGLDKAMKTGVRGSVKNMNPKEWWKSVKRGYQEGVEDVDLGINTARSGEIDRYELGFHPQFEGVPVLGKAEKALNYSIRVPDRMFYEGKFDSSFKDLMSTGKFTREEAEEIARNEALQAVFQGKGILSKSSKAVRDFLDENTGNLLLGSRIAPFVQTPANLIAEGLERSPLGLAKGAYQLGKAISPQELRVAQETLAKGLTGTAGATVGGGLLLNKIPNTIGGFTNEDMYGDEIRNLPPQSVVIGDKAVSLASLPYLTIPMGMGKTLFDTDKTIPERALNSIAYTGNILSDLPMLKGLGDLYKGVADVGETATKMATKQSDIKDVLQSVGRVAGQQGANMLSQYVPFGGTLGTIRNTVDPYNREMMTYDENPAIGAFEYIGNRIINRIPFASKALPVKYNALGEPSMRNNIENDWLRGLEAMVSPIRVRNYTERPAEMDEMQRLQDFALENDITGKFAKPKRYIGRGKDKIRLTNKQYSELTRLYNGKVYEELQFLMNTPEYQAQDDETKIKWVREVMKEKKNEAEVELFDIMK